MNNQRITRFLFSVLFVFVSLIVVNAQTAVTPAMQNMINKELVKRGLSESAVQARLQAEGIDLSNVPPDQLPQYKSRVTAILDQMQAEKKAKAKQDTTAQTATPVNVTVVNPSTPSSMTNPVGTQAGSNAQPTMSQSMDTVAQNPVTTLGEAVADVQQKVIQQKTKNIPGENIYGHSIFSDQSLSVFRTTDGAQAPDTYVLGEGDEIRISIFGASQTDIQQRVAPDGSIQPTGVAKVFVKGLTLAQARKLLRDRLSYAYSFRPDQFAITIVTARTILVNIFGEVKTTGGFTISALNSAFNALSAAGGPTNIGSVRNIQLIRGKTKRTIDVYKFMNDPSKEFDFSLQNNDIIFVPVAQKLVTIDGAVNRPMTYEMLPKEDLKDLIKYAGGLKMNVYPDFVQVERYVNGEKRLFEYKLEDVMNGKQTVDLVNGDVVRIKTINKPLDQYVNIDGNGVYYPGQYNITSNTKLSELLANAQPTKEANLNVIFVERLNPDKTFKQIAVYWNDSIKADKDFTLKPEDKVHVTDLSRFIDRGRIAVSGNVRDAFNMTFSLRDSLTVKQAIEMAGGTKTDTYPFAYVKRQNLRNPKEIKYIRLELSKSGDYSLHPGDELMVMSNNNFIDSKSITVSGDVRKPFTQIFSYSDHITINKAIELANGLNTTAYPIAYVMRQNLMNPKEKQYIRLEIATSGNFELQAGDELIILNKDNFTDTHNISVNGNVRKPFTQTFASTDHIKIEKAIELADGLKTTAFNTAFIFRPDLKNPLKMKYIRVDLKKDSAMELLPGDQLNIYDNTTYLNQGSLNISGAVKNPGSFTFDSSMTLHNLILNAGGFDLGAAFNKVQVFRADLSSTKKVKFKLITVTVDSAYQVVEPENFQLQPFDHVVVRMIPEFTTGRTVEINGEVNFPGVYVLDGKETQLAEIIKKAGGLLRSADPYGATLFRTYRNRGMISINIRKAMHHRHNYSENPILFEGDVININRMENTVTIMGKGTRIVNYVMDTTTLAKNETMFHALDTQNYPSRNVVYRGHKSASWYVNNFAGGYDKYADKYSVTVTYPNDEIHSAHRFLFITCTPKVVPGSTINIQLNEKKIQKTVKPVEHQDLETTVSKSLSVLMSTLSIILLLQRL